MVRQHSVRGVAHQYRAATLPIRQWRDFEQPPTKVVLHGAYHFDNGGMPSFESGERDVVRDRRNPALVRPRLWSFDNGEKIYVRSRGTKRKVEQMCVGAHPELNRVRIR